MILEYIESLLVSAPKWARHMGYVREAIAIEARAKRCKANWASHQNNTKAAILEAVETRDQNRTVLLVGSGACLDVPLAELAQIFERVVLVDVVHPRKSKRHGLDNVVQVDLDITGHMATLCSDPGILPDVISPTFYHDFPDIDFVLSVNVASQLPVMPLQYLAKMTGRKLSHDDDVLDSFSKDIIAAHFRWLSGFKCPAALICDRAWERLDLSGKLLVSDDPLYELNMIMPAKEWYWDVAPAKEIGANYARRNRVGYWSNFLNTAFHDISAPSGVESTESK